MQNQTGGARVLPGIRGAILFYLLAFILSWAVWGLPIINDGLVDWAPLLIMIGAYGPLVAALLLLAFNGGRKAIGGWFRQVVRFRGRWGWILLGGFGLPLLIALVHLLLYRLAVGPVNLSTDPPWYWAVAVVPVNVLVLAWFSSAVEEFGWQGFALPRLTERLHPLSANLLHGVLWGTWHLPLYLLAGWSGAGQPLWLFYGITLTLAPILFWLTRKAGGSVIPAVLFHAATNLYTEMYQGSEVFGGSLSTYFVEIKTALYLVVALTIIVGTRGWLGARRKKTAEQEAQVELAV